jgi:hypothetical protein
MTRRIDLTGQRFGRLTVLGYSHTTKGQAFWDCQCDCGNQKKIRGGDLRSGKSLSCKCLNYEVSTTHHMSKTKIYMVWVNMHSRCYKEYSPEYKRYGARGIKVCDKWQTFEGFFEDMSETYQEGLSLDRIYVNGDYSKDNCRWTDNITQQKNRRITKFYTLNGETETFTYFCRKYNVDYELARGRLRHGWDIEKIFTTPSQRHKNN